MADIKFPDDIPALARSRCLELWSLCGSNRDWRDLLNRLIVRDEMRQVFAWVRDIVKADMAALSSASASSLDDAIGQRASQFVDAAWSAHMDFKKYREQVQRGAGLSAQIGAAAEKLAGLLREADKAGVNFPFEFSSVRAFLRQAENYEGNDSIVLWRAFRPALVDGDALVRSAWEKAPAFHYLLDALAGVAMEFKPTGQSETICAALAGRQGNKKTDYLRAFASLLLGEHKFPVSSTLIHAMAVTATVVIDDPGIAVAYDDVKKTLDRFESSNEVPDSP